MKRLISLIAIITLFVAAGGAKVVSTSGSKPEWMNKGESHLNDKRSNPSYYFKIVNLSGPSLENLKAERVNQLSSYIGQSHRISGTQETTIDQVSTGGNVTGKEQFSIRFSNDISAEPFYAKIVDDYWEYVAYPDGTKGYEYYALFAVSDTQGQPVYDTFDFTTSYGATPVVMSIIPGLGQFYKGSKGKAIGFISAEIAAVAAIVWTDNERASYIKKAKEHPKFAKEYSDKASNWETGRNVCIGVAGGIWLWNIIDAAASKGARRMVVKDSYGRGLSVAPYATPMASGVSLTYRF